MVEPAWLKEIRLLRQQQEEERRRNAELEDGKIFSQTTRLANVNVSLESFVLQNGIREHICSHAVRLGLRGFVRRTHHAYVEVHFDGTDRQLSDFKAILQDLQRRTLSESLEIGHVVELRLGHENDSFEIKTNTHTRYDRNPNSNGDQCKIFNSC